MKINSMGLGQQAMTRGEYLRREAERDAEAARAKPRATAEATASRAQRVA